MPIRGAESLTESEAGRCWSSLSRISVMSAHMTMVFIETSIEDIRAEVGRQPVVCGLSGGVDSTVVAALVHRAMIVDIYLVDHGFMKK